MKKETRADGRYALKLTPSSREPVGCEAIL